MVDDDRLDARRRAVADWLAGIGEEYIEVHERQDSIEWVTTVDLSTLGEFVEEFVRVLEVIEEGVDHEASGRWPNLVVFNLTLLPRELDKLGMIRGKLLASAGEVERGNAISDASISAMKAHTEKILSYGPIVVSHRVTRRAAPLRRPRARGHRSRPAARRAAGIRAGQDPGDPEPGEHEPAAPRLSLAPKPRTIYTYAVLTAEQRGAA